MTLDIDAYLARIDSPAVGSPTAATLFALHEAHASTIPFENLAIQLGELPIRLDLASLQAKLVRRRRGGYCFEQNLLFKAALEVVGFAVVPCEARVRLGSSKLLPRTHLTLLATAGGQTFVCDVGFGGEGLLLPVPVDGAAHDQPGATLRVARERGLHVLQAAGAQGWTDLYAFAPHAVSEPDWEVANWYTSTHPESRFVTTLTVQRAARDARQVLRGLTYTRTEPGRTTTRELHRDELVPFLRATFALDLPDHAHFRALDRAAC